MMNRRRFLGTMFGAALGATIISKVVENVFSTPKNNTMPNTNSPVLMGYKGHLFIETGYVYAPYIPLQMVDINTL